ncbi:MAG: DMT family transporter [Deltaproteobacteria bacterium]|nr:DMT family transporter [Deltaproteobacteria bacterium]MBW1846529.1 DMT family transporter [Deltaproteobacteria bacterium]MBW2181428.1 DMT family transporter [Deltaproteobacteria bacterium]
MEKEQLISKNKISRSGDLFLIAAVFAWGVNFPFAKLALGFMDPVVFSATRYGVASILLFCILWQKKTSIAISFKEVLQLIVVGLFGVTLFQGGWAYGLNLTSASKASVLITTSPIFAALISAFLGNRPSFLSWCGILLSFFGVAVVINNSLTEITMGIGTIVGDLLIVGASFMWVLYTFVSKPIVSRRGPILVTAWSMFFGAAMLAIAGIPAFILQDWNMVSIDGWLSWAFTAVFGAALAFVWYCAGIVRIGITRGMVYGFLIPVVAILTSVLFFGEVMTLVQLFGSVIVLVGVKMTRSG